MRFERFLSFASVLGLVAALPALVALATLTGCAHSHPPASYSLPGPSASARPGFRLSDADVQEIVKEVSAARQLTPTRPVAVVRVDHAHFIDHLLHDPADKPAEGGSKPGALSSEAAFLLGFDFVPPPGKRAGIASTDDVLEEQVAGYYDRRTDQVYLPDRSLQTEDELREQRAVLAHEVQHALQAQRFARAEEKKPASSDAALARLALMEGDAMVAMGATMGAIAGAPVGRTLRRIVEEVKKVPIATVTRGEHRQKLDAALEVTRKRLLFPYEDGLLFVSDVYRAGGFPLVDRIYERPPTTTEQILHPAKYLAGETAHAVSDPEPPPGYSAASVDTLGELSTRVLLARCLPPAQADEAASGWAGDRFGVFTNPAGKLALLWVSAWDSEEDAIDVEDSLAKSGPCWHDNALGSGSDSAHDVVIGADILVRRRGKVVAFERGLPEAIRASAIEHLFPLVGPEPPRTPLTTLRIPPRVPLPEPTPGSIEDDVYEDAWLGVVGRVPAGMIPKIDGSGARLLVSRPDSLVRGGFAFSGRVTTDEQNAITFGEISSGLAVEAARAGGRTDLIGSTTTDTPLGKGTERTWQIAGTQIGERVILVPICAGTGSIAFIEVYGDPYARTVLDGWINSFRWEHGRSVTACDYLDPK